MSELRDRERRLMFWNAVVKTINVTMVFGVPPCVLFAVLIPYELTHYEGQNTVYVKPQVRREGASRGGVRAGRCVGEPAPARRAWKWQQVLCSGKTPALVSRYLHVPRVCPAKRLP